MVHAPHAPMPHPYFVPTRPKESRSTHSSGVSGVTSTERDWPFTLRVYLLIGAEVTGEVSPKSTKSPQRVTGGRAPLRLQDRRSRSSCQRNGARLASRHCHLEPGLAF